MTTRCPLESGSDGTLCQIRRCEDNERARALVFRGKTVIPEQHSQQGLPPPSLSTHWLSILDKLHTLHPPSAPLHHRWSSRDATGPACATRLSLTIPTLVPWKCHDRSRDHAPVI